MGKLFRNISINNLQLFLELAVTVVRIYKTHYGPKNNRAKNQLKTKNRNAKLLFHKEYLALIIHYNRVIGKKIV